MNWIIISLIVIGVLILAWVFRVYLDWRKSQKTSNKNYSQRKKDKDETQNVSLSGDTKMKQGKTINNEYMPTNSDNHADIIPKNKRGWGRSYGY